MRRRICLLVLIGLPAMGKTSFCKWLLSIPSEQRNFNVIHFCYDKFLELYSSTKLSTNDSQTPYKDQRADIFDALTYITSSLISGQGLNDILKDKIDMSIMSCVDDFVIICDDNNYYSSMRYKLYKFCKENRLAYSQIHFEGNLELSLTRNAERLGNERIPENVITAMYGRLEPPDQHKRHWETATLNIISSDFNRVETQTIFNFIAKSFDQELSSDDEPKCIPEIQVQSLTHQIDLVLRRRIKELMNDFEMTKTEKKLKAKMLNDKRKEILQSIKESENGVEVVNFELSDYVKMLDI